MIFQWPLAFALMALIPLLLAAYILMQKRRKRMAVRFSSLSLVRQAVPRGSWIKRHLPFGLFLLALASLVLALGRPVQVVDVPSSQATIILAMDVSLSMRSRDITPSRIRAAQDAALSFIDRQKPGTQIGIVAFAGIAEMVQAPTADRQALRTAIESLTLGRRTGIGEGILTAIDAIAEIDPQVAPSTSFGSEAAPAPLPSGAYAPDIIVLLTDGVSNTGTTPLEAAQQASDRGIRTYTIGFGTENGSITMGGGGLEPPPGYTIPSTGGGPGGGRFRVGIDEETLKIVAEMTGGQYYAATSASELNEVFASLPTYLITRREMAEISVIFAAAGALLGAIGMALAQLWRPLP